MRLARHTTSRSLSNLDAEDRLIVLDCINAAIYNWFAAVPEHMRQTTVSHVVRNSETITPTMTNLGNSLGGVELDEYHLGAAIDIAGDSVMNEIVSTDPAQILNPYRGSTGSASATIYFDTIMLTDYYVSRIVNHPRVLDSGRTLVRDENIRFMGAERKGMESPLGVYGANIARNFGEPYRYTIDNTGVSLKDEARMMIRLDPIPSGELTIVFDAVIDPVTHGLDAINGTTDIAVPEQYVIPHLVPLALSELALSPIWGIGDSNAALARGEKIIGVIQNDLPLNRARPQNRARTRKGW